MLLSKKNAAGSERIFRRVLFFKVTLPNYVNAAFLSTKMDEVLFLIVAPLTRGKIFF